MKEEARLECGGTGSSSRGMAIWGHMTTRKRIPSTTKMGKHLNWLRPVLGLQKGNLLARLSLQRFKATEVTSEGQSLEARTNIGATSTRTVVDGRRGLWKSSVRSCSF
jgi:hypothetical protein